MVYEVYHWKQRGAPGFLPCVLCDRAHRQALLLVSPSPPFREQGGGGGARRAPVLSRCPPRCPTALKHPSFTLSGGLLTPSRYTPKFFYLGDH